MPKFYAPLLTALLYICNAAPSAAQVIRDESVNTRVSSSVPARFVITGGQQVGRNLFHSFSEFSVPANGSAIFNNGATVRTIFSRVTGDAASNIQGTIRAQGSANLFLLNPNGILFGPNAQLDIGGSFLATTAERVRFADDREFNTKDTLNQPLLSVHTPLGLQWGDKPASVRAQRANLAVNPGQTLSLAGGNILLDRSSLSTAGGRVELSGLSAAGTLELNDNLGFEVSNNVLPANIQLTGSRVDVTAAEGGYIVFNGRNIDILDGSSVVTGIEAGLKNRDAQSGNIELNATQGIVLTKASTVENLINEEAVGNSGDINLKARTIRVLGGSRISTNIAGRGDAGLVKLQAKKSILFKGEAPVLEGEDLPEQFSGRTDIVDFYSGIFSRILEQARGKSTSQGVEIETGSLVIRDGARIAATVRNKGQSEVVNPVKISASESVLFAGEDSAGSPSGVFSQISKDGRGKVEGIIIQTPSLILRDGALVGASILSGPREIDGVKIDGTNVGGNGEVGGITIKAQSILFEGETNASLEGDKLRGGRTSGVASVVASDATGQVGLINIEADSIIFRDGGRASTSIFGKGDAGGVSIRAKSILFEGETQSFNVNDEIKGARTSGVFSEIKGESLANAPREIFIEADSLTLKSGGQVSTTTRGGETAGNIKLQVRDDIFLSGKAPSGKESGIFASTTESSTGNGGSIIIDPARVTVQDGARISVNSEGEGQGGDIELTAGVLLLNNGKISAETSSNQGGDITLYINDLLSLRNNSAISSTAGNNQLGGDGGNIVINTPILFAVPGENSDITANAFTGDGGTIGLNAQGIFGIAKRDLSGLLNDITASSGSGIEGEVEINTPEIDPSQDQLELPQSLLSSVPFRECSGPGKSTFVDTRRSGKPLEPSEFGTFIGWDDLRPVGDSASRSSLLPKDFLAEAASPLTEAQGWIVTRDGYKVLVAQPSHVTPNAMAQATIPCQS